MVAARQLPARQRSGINERAGEFNLNLSIISEPRVYTAESLLALTIVGTSVELKAKAHSARVVGEGHQAEAADADNGHLQVVLLHRVRVQVPLEVLF